MREKVGIGFIGTGFARRVQMPAFLECDGARIVSVASGDVQNARSAADEFDIGHCTSDWHETVLHPEVDLICITTPPNLHREMAVFAIENGKHVLCEKPMAMDVAETEEMIAAADGKSLLTLIDHELRFQPGRQTAYKMLRGGEIGKIRHAKAIFQAPSRGDKNLPWNWWSDAESGGGALGAINSHVVDSFNWLLGTTIKDVFCQLQSHIKERRDVAGVFRPVTTDDEANMLLRFADSDLTHDATGIVSVSMTEIPKYQNRIEIYGTGGAMRIDHRGGLFIAKMGDDDWRKIEVGFGRNIEGVPDTGFGSGFMEFAPKIVDAIRNGETKIENAATFIDGLEVQRILDAARESDRTGCRITLSKSQ